MAFTRAQELPFLGDQCLVFTLRFESNSGNPSMAVLLFFFSFEIGFYFCSLGMTYCSLCSPGWLRTLWLSFQAQPPKHWNSRCEPHTSGCIFPPEGKSQRSVNTAIPFPLPLTVRFWCYAHQGFFKTKATGLHRGTKGLSASFCIYLRSLVDETEWRILLLP